MGRGSKASRAKCSSRRNNKEPSRETGGSTSKELNQLVQQLDPLGFHVRRMEDDGNCLFRSFADQVTGRAEDHQRFRAECCDFMVENMEDFEPFHFDDSKDGKNTFQSYVKKMRLAGVWGSQLELMALCRRYNIHAAVHQSGRKPYVMGNAPENAQCIQVSYENGNHYNSVRFASDVCLQKPAQYITLLQLKGQPNVEEDAKQSKDPQQGLQKTEDVSQQAAFNEEGYMSMLKLNNIDQMKDYIRRFTCALGLVVDEGAMDGVVSLFGGCKASKTFSELKQELVAAASQDPEPKPAPLTRAQKNAARRKAKRAAKKDAAQAPRVDEQMSLLGSSFLCV